MFETIVIIALVILFVVVTLNASVTLALVKERKQSRFDIGGPEKGSVLPAFQAMSLASGTMVDSSHLVMPSSLLVFGTNTCGVCSKLLVDLRDRLTVDGGRSPVPLTLIWHGVESKDGIDIQGLLGELASVVEVGIQSHEERATLYALGFNGSPAYVQLDEKKRVMQTGIPSLEAEPLAHIIA